MLFRSIAAAVEIAVTNIFDHREIKPSDSSDVSGIAVSPGECEGVARIIKDSSDFDRIQQGDVLIAINTSASFNVILPLISAVVTDHGGMLSHAAIVAREYGIPGVVCTQDATEKIADGTRVRVDGNNGTVKKVA